MTETIATVDGEPQFGDWWAASEAEIPHCVWNRRIPGGWSGACRQEFVPRIRIAEWNTKLQALYCQECLDRLAVYHVPTPPDGCDSDCDSCKRRRRLGLSLISYPYP